MTPQSQKILLIDIDSCVRCHACTIACRQEHGLSVETESSWCRVMTVGPRRVAGKLHMDFIPVLCFQCNAPMCADVCPSGAIAKNEAGLVLIDEKTCTGCGLCVDGCPYGCMSFNKVKQTAGHCDLCRERVESGIEPACVQHCIGGALQFVTTGELAGCTSGQHRSRLGRICYISNKWRLQNLF
jgi:Fe-S-cluster-containing dehydrogenase component